MISQQKPCISMNIIKCIVKKHLPDVGLISCYPLSGGLFNTTYLLVLSDAGKAVLRIAPNKALLFQYEQYLMQAEKMAYDLCHQQLLPVPNVIYVDDSMQLIDRTFMLTEYINGSSLHQIKLSEEEKSSCYREAGRTIKGIHSISGSRFGRLAYLITGKGFKTWGEAIIYEVEEWKRTTYPLHLLSERAVAEIDEVFIKFLPVLNEIIVPYLAHGDLWIGNILADTESGRCSFKAVIDADHAIFGDPEFDFPNGRQINKAFAEGYGKALNQNRNSYIRRKLYLLLVSMRQCYVFKYILNDDKLSSAHRGYIEKLLHELRTF